MARRKHVLKALALALGGLFVAAACSSDGSGPPKAGCPEGFCAPGPICSEGCSSACGCCGCSDGATYNYKGVPHVCSGGCFKPVGTPLDAGTDATPIVDAAPDVPDCDALGCGDTICGQNCTDPCGCCACTEFETKDIGGVMYTCLGGCYQPPP